MKITDISVQARNPDRVNISIDGKFSFSLDIFQVGELGIKNGSEITDDKLAQMQQASVFGKLYGRTLEYTLMRPRSAKEVRDYLWRKTRETKYKSKRTGEVKLRDGVPIEVADLVFSRLVEKGYIDDAKFTRYWVENRNQQKGSSLRKLTNELRLKGVSQNIIDACMSESDRNDNDELVKIITKKQSKYPDRQKFMSYLARQGFSYDDIKSALEELDAN